MEMGLLELDPVSSNEIDVNVGLFNTGRLDSFKFSGTGIICRSSSSLILTNVDRWSANTGILSTSLSDVIEVEEATIIAVLSVVAFKRVFSSAFPSVVCTEPSSNAGTFATISLCMSCMPVVCIDNGEDEAGNIAGGWTIAVVVATEICASEVCAPEVLLSGLAPAFIDFFLVAPSLLSSLDLSVICAGVVTRKSIQSYAQTGIAILGSFESIRVCNVFCLSFEKTLPNELWKRLRWWRQ